MTTATIELDTRKLKKALKEKTRKLLIQKQLTLASFMDEVREDAADNQIIKNTTGFRKPSIARRLQAPTSGRLTERTGKLKWALNEKAKSQNPTRHWTGYGNKLVKLSTSTIKMLIRRQGTSHSLEGTMRVSISNMHGRLTSTFFGMPQETPSTMRARFAHEDKGRQFITPAFNKLSKSVGHKLEVNFSSEWVK